MPTKQEVDSLIYGFVIAAAILAAVFGGWWLRLKEETSECPDSQPGVTIPVSPPR